MSQQTALRAETPDIAPLFKADSVTLSFYATKDGKSLTLGGEINKLASNIALARDAAGVHFRSDSINGLKLGKAVGIGLLADYTRTYSERFDGFVLTGFDGQKVRVSRASSTRITALRMTFIRLMLVRSSRSLWVGLPGALAPARRAQACCP